MATVFTNKKPVFVSKVTLFQLEQGDNGFELKPYLVNDQQVQQEFANRAVQAAREGGFEIFRVLVGPMLDNISEDEMLAPVTVNRDIYRGKAVYFVHGSSAKEGWAYYILVEKNGKPIPAAVEYLVDTYRQIGIYERLVQGGSNEMPKTVAYLVPDEPYLAMDVPDGTILETADGKFSIFADGHSVFDRSVFRHLFRTDTLPFAFKPATLLSANNISHLEQSEELFEELLADFAEDTAKLKRSTYSDWLRDLRFGKKRGDLAGTAVLGNVAFTDDLMAQMALKDVHPDVRTMFMLHGAFANKMPKSMAKTMYRMATTGGIKAKTHVYLPIPSFPGEDDIPVVVLKQEDGEKAVLSRQPESDDRSSLAVIIKNDDRNKFRAGAAQFRVAGRKGIASSRVLEGAILHIPDGTTVPVPAGVTHLFGENDRKYKMDKQQPLLIPFVMSAPTHITEIYKPNAMMLVPCGYIAGDTVGNYAGKVFEYNADSNTAKIGGADFDGDKGQLANCTDKPVFWQAHRDKNLRNIVVPKIAKGQTDMPEFSNLEEFQALSTKIYEILVASAANYIGMLANLMERFLLFSPVQREIIAQTRFGMSAIELTKLFYYFKQVAVDVYKIANKELVAEMEEFIKTCISAFKLSDADDIGKIPHGHVGKDKNDAIVGDGEMWFINHIPEIGEDWDILQGTVPEMMKRTLAKNEFGEYVRWFGELGKNWGILPNDMFVNMCPPVGKNLMDGAKHLIHKYGQMSRGVAVTYELIDKDEAKNDWRTRMEQLHQYAVDYCESEGFSAQNMFYALWNHYHSKAVQTGDQSLPMIIFPNEFIDNLTKLVKTWDNKWVHPEMLAHAESVNPPVPVLGVTKLWKGYPDTEIIQQLDGQTIEVNTVSQLLEVGSNAKRIVSAIVPIDGTDFAGLLADWKVPAGSLGYTQTTTEGEMLARFNWKPGKTSGGSMMVTFMKK